MYLSTTKQKQKNLRKKNSRVHIELLWAGKNSRKTGERRERREGGIESEGSCLKSIFAYHRVFFANLKKGLLPGIRRVKYDL